MKAHLYKMECITNMHVGSGDVNYNIIDNEVQKDPVLADVPTIHASSLKGAIKEHFEGRWSKGDGRIEKIFGSKDSFSSEDDGKTYKFFSAHLIARPLRVSEGNGRPYVLTTATDILENFASFLAHLGLGGFYAYREPQERFPDGGFLVSPGTGITSIEGNSAASLSGEKGKDQYGIGKLIGETFAVAKNLPLLDYPLPVIARNCLNDKGISTNVWYEEVVPHKSVFYFVVMIPTDACELDFSGPVQFGANGSIGYGYTEITEVIV